MATKIINSRWLSDIHDAGEHTGKKHHRMVAWMWMSSYIRHPLCPSIMPAICFQRQTPADCSPLSKTNLTIKKQKFPQINNSEQFKSIYLRNSSFINLPVYHFLPNISQLYFNRYTNRLSLPIYILRNPYAVLSFVSDSPVRPCFFNISNKRRPLLILMWALYAGDSPVEQWPLCYTWR